MSYICGNYYKLCCRSKETYKFKILTNSTFEMFCEDINVPCEFDDSLEFYVNGDLDESKTFCTNS